jgi:hypothetical protein
VPTVVDAGGYPPFLPSAIGDITGTTRALPPATKPMREIVHRPVDCAAAKPTVAAIGVLP